jgi:hypothetical protein
MLFCNQHDVPMLCEMKMMGTSVPEDVSMTVCTFLPHIIEISVPIYQLAQATPQKTLNLFNNAT